MQKDSSTQTEPHLFGQVSQVVVPLELFWRDMSTLNSCLKTKSGMMPKQLPPTTGRMEQLRSTDAVVVPMRPSGTENSRLGRPHFEDNYSGYKCLFRGDASQEKKDKDQVEDSGEALVWRLISAKELFPNFYSKPASRRIFLQLATMWAVPGETRTWLSAPSVPWIKRNVSLSSDWSIFGGGIRLSGKSVHVCNETIMNPV